MPKEEAKVVVAKSAAELQKIRLEKLMSNPNKPVVIPDRPESKLPKVFNPPEFVRNIWGSSAGAGSGDFHVYRGVRRREYARQKFLDQQQEKNDLDAQHKTRVETNNKISEERTAKKRAKRQKKKAKQKMKKLNQTQKKEVEQKEDGSNQGSSEDEESTGQGDAGGVNGDKEPSPAAAPDTAESHGDTNADDDSGDETEAKRAKLATQPEDANDAFESDDDVES